jgi:SRSO17 transposase
MPGEDAEVKYCISNLPEDTPKIQLIQYLHRRETIERFYQDAKTDLGLDQYEGRMWHGFHRHFIMVMLTYSFLSLRCREYGQQNTKYETSLDSVSSPPLGNEKGVFSPSSILG